VVVGVLVVLGVPPAWYMERREPEVEEGEGVSSCMVDAMEAGEGGAKLALPLPPALVPNVVVVEPLPAAAAAAAAAPAPPPWLPVAVVVAVRAAAMAGVPPVEVEDAEENLCSTAARRGSARAPAPVPAWAAPVAQLEEVGVVASPPPGGLPPPPLPPPLPPPSLTSRSARSLSFAVAASPAREEEWEAEEAWEEEAAEAVVAIVMAPPPPPPPEEEEEEEVEEGSAPVAAAPPPPASSAGAVVEVALAQLAMASSIAWVRSLRPRTCWQPAQQASVVSAGVPPLQGRA
jgi:hypothetical protein